MTPRDLPLQETAPLAAQAGAGSDAHAAVGSASGGCDTLLVRDARRERHGRLSGGMPVCRLYGPPGLHNHLAGFVAGICWDRIGDAGRHLRWRRSTAIASSGSASPRTRTPGQRAGAGWRAAHQRNVCGVRRLLPFHFSRRYVHDVERVYDEILHYAGGMVQVEVPSGTR